MVFFTNVLRLLQERGLTKKWLAEHAGVSNSFVTDITKGRNLSLKTMEAIAKALDVPLPALLEESDVDRHSQKELAQNGVLLPDGYEWVTAILPAHRAFTVRKWADETKEKIQRLTGKDSTNK